MEQKDKDEFEWFDFETRMRKLVVELIQPTLLKINLDRENVSALKATIMTEQKRVDNLELIVLKKDTKNTHFDNIYEKFSTIVIYINI